MNSFTPEQANTRIAEILGYTLTKCRSVHHVGCTYWRFPDGSSSHKLPNWYCDSNAFERDCVPMLREKQAPAPNVLIKFRIGEICYCTITVATNVNYGIKHITAEAPTIPASAALAFIEAMT